VDEPFAGRGEPGMDRAASGDAADRSVDQVERAGGTVLFGPDGNGTVIADN